MGADLESSEAIARLATEGGVEASGGECGQIVARELPESIDLLGGKLDEINSTLLATVPSDNISIAEIGTAIFIAIIGAFSAYMFSYFHWRMVRKKDYFSKIAQILSAHIRELESIAIQYWVSCYEDHDKQSILANEISIKTKLRLIARYAKKLGPLLDKSRYPELEDELTGFSQDIFDEASGGDFESCRRVENPKRAQVISRLCADMQSKLVLLED